MQIFDFLLLFVIICFIENYRIAFKYLKFWKQDSKKITHENPQSENTMEL